MFSWLSSHHPPKQGPVWLLHVLGADASLQPTKWRQVTYAGSVWAGWFCQEGVLSASWQVVGLGSQAEALARVQFPQQVPPHPHCHPGLAQHFLFMKSGVTGWGAGRSMAEEKQGTHTKSHILLSLVTYLFSSIKVHLKMLLLEFLLSTLTK